MVFDLTDPPSVDASNRMGRAAARSLTVFIEFIERGPVVAMKFALYAGSPTAHPTAGNWNTCPTTCLAAPEEVDGHHFSITASRDGEGSAGREGQRTMGSTKRFPAACVWPRETDGVAAGPQADGRSLFQWARGLLVGICCARYANSSTRDPKRKRTPGCRGGLLEQETRSESARHVARRRDARRYPCSSQVFTNPTAN